jgi:hypothetical protein
MTTSAMAGKALGEPPTPSVIKKNMKTLPTMGFVIQFYGQHLHSKRNTGHSHAQTDISFLITSGF